jgi:hypothetical protein
MSRWRKLRELSWADRRVLLYAAVLLIRARLTVPYIDFRADPGAADGVHATPPARAALLRAAAQNTTLPNATLPDTTLPGTTLQRAQTIARLVGIAAAHVPLDVACLHRSLVLWRLLRGRGIPCVLRLGAGTGGGAFEAHAWVECAGVALNEGADHLSRFRPFGQAVRPVGRRPRWRLATRRAS